MSVLLFGGCGSKVRDEATGAVDAYNAEAQRYNESIVQYNEAVAVIKVVNSDLKEVIDAAQEVINKGEEPYDSETLNELKNAMSSAQEAKVSEPDKIAEVQILTITEEMKSSELKALTEQVNKDIETLKAFAVPDTPEVPDYSDEISAVETARKIYENGIQSLKQVTAPSDDFVMERLQRIDTITMMDAVTEDHDPNGELGKQGGYIGCIYFRDSQVDQSQLYVDGDPQNVIDVGTQGGGAIEIFSNVEDAEKRDAYLGGFDGTPFASGSHYVVGTLLIRTSDELSGTKQLELTDKITEIPDQYYTDEASCDDRREE